MRVKTRPRGGCKAQFGKAFPSTDQHTVSFNAFLSYLAKKNDLKSMEWES